MQGDLAPIGSIVRVRDVLLVVAGHRLARDDQHMGLCYLLVPYPLGFISAQSLSITPASKIDEVLFTGLNTNEGQEYLGALSSALESIKGVGYHDYADAVLAFNNYLKEEGAAK